MSIEPTLTHIEPFVISGLSVRTCNQDEFNLETARLPHLWAQFAASHPVAPVYGVYSDYDSDASGFYTMTAGTQTSNPTLSNVTIQAGQYLVFSGHGTMPQAVIDTWKRVWAYFETPGDYKRNFVTDFECYSGADEIAVYIGVTNK